MTFGLQCDEVASPAILDRAAAGGIDFLDTADVYPLGGDFDDGGAHRGDRRRWLKGKRHDFIVATKCVGAMGPKPWDQGMSRKHILDAIDASLRRLGTDYVDLYQLHRYDPTTPIDEALEALDAVVRAGKARYVGVSNWPAYKVARALGPQRAQGRRRASTRCSRATTCSSAPSSATCCRSARRRAIGVIPYNPLAGGLLTGKHDATRAATRGTRFTLGTRRRRRYQERYWHEREFETVETLRAVAADAGMSMATHGRGLGAREPRHHRADRRREPARAAGRQSRGGRNAASRRPQEEARRTAGAAWRAVDARRRSPMAGGRSDADR